MFDLVLDFEYKDVDTATITIPAGYNPESIPADVTIESRLSGNIQPQLN